MNASDVTSRARGMVGRASRGQTTAEYAIVIGVVAAALIGMQIYLKRGMNARLKMISDHEVGSVWTAFGKTATPVPQQYEPYYASSAFTSTQDASHADHTAQGNVVTRTGVSETTTRSGSQQTGAAQ